MAANTTTGDMQMKVWYIVLLLICSVVAVCV